MSGFGLFFLSLPTPPNTESFMLGAKSIVMMEPSSDTKHPLGILFKNVPTDLLDSSRENHVSQINV